MPRITATIVSGGYPQQIVEVKAYYGNMVFIVCWPDPTPRWVSRAKPMLVADA